MGGMLQIRLSGSGGQGLILAGRILAAALVAAGRRVAQSQSYEPTSRGGLSRADLVVTDAPADFPLVTALDYLVILDERAAHASDDLLAAGSVVLCDTRRVTSRISGPFALHRLPLWETAIGVGSPRVANIVALGALAAIGGIVAPDLLRQKVVGLAPPRFRDLNAEAFDTGYELAAHAPTVARPSQPSAML